MGSHGRCVRSPTTTGWSIGLSGYGSNASAASHILLCTSRFVLAWQDVVNLNLCASDLRSRSDWHRRHVWCRLTTEKAPSWLSLVSSFFRVMATVKLVFALHSPSSELQRQKDSKEKCREQLWPFRLRICDAKYSRSTSFGKSTNLFCHKFWHLRAAAAPAAKGRPKIQDLRLFQVDYFELCPPQ